MQTAIAAIFVFLLVVLLHELGHFTVAKLVGIKVNEFSIGMGPKLLQVTKGETVYSLRALPVGGYVKMEGEDENSDDPRSFSNSSVLARIATIAAGAFMNFVLAIIVLSIVAFNVGTPTTTISETIENSPAAVYGLESGDRIATINGTEILKWQDIIDTINKYGADSSIIVEVERDNSLVDYEIQPVEENGRVVIGIYPQYEHKAGTSIKAGFEDTGYFVKLMFEFLRMLFQGRVSTDDLAGPVGVITEVGNAARDGLMTLLYILGFISVNLGFFNLLPIPALDGSRIIFLLIELVRGKPLDPKKEGFIHMLGFIFLISLMLIVTYKDIIRINLF
ncbi:MAG: RIP metalloprotease RseP [Gudongella sp.]|jgi:regulator of sigma E protease|nr:RIP metalloprotease RseP [Gudongella sp.]